MKIVQVITALNLGGAQTLLENLSYALQELGQEITVISLESLHSATAERIEDRGIRIIYLDKQPHFDPAIAGKLGKVLRELQPDIVHAHNIKKLYVYLACRKAGLRHIVYTVHNMAGQEQGLIGGAFSFVMFQSGKMVPVGISPEVTRSIKKRYHLKIVPTIYNGTDLDRFRIKRDFRLHDQPCILNVARLDAQKNHKRLVEAFSIVSRRFPQSRLVLVGEGELEGVVRQAVHENGLDQKVMFEGLQEDIPGYMKNADIFCLSSDYEGMPMTLIEAMAGEMPIVTTCVGGVPDMLQNGYSALLTEPDAGQLAEAVIRLLLEEPLRKTLGKNAGKAVNKFSHIRMAKRYVSLYQRICSE